MRKSLQSLVMLLIASSLMPLMARPHHNRHEKVVVVSPYGHGHHDYNYGCRPYGYKYKQVYHQTCRPRRPLVNVCPAPVVHHCEPTWGSDVMVVRPRPQLQVTVNF